jgi:hypothetical protein
MEVPPNFITIRAICLSNLFAGEKENVPKRAKTALLLAAAADMASNAMMQALNDLPVVLPVLEQGQAHRHATG